MSAILKHRNYNEFFKYLSCGVENVMYFPRYCIFSQSLYKVFWQVNILYVLAQCLTNDSYRNFFSANFQQMTATVQQMTATLFFSTIFNKWQLPFHLTQFLTNDSNHIIQHIFTTNNWATEFYQQPYDLSTITTDDSYRMFQQMTLTVSFSTIYNWQPLYFS